MPHTLMSSAPNDTSETELKRLRWQCRRGMRELDVVLTRFLDNEYAGATDELKQAFEALLRRPDPELIGLVLGRDAPPNETMATLLSYLHVSAPR